VIGNCFDGLDLNKVRPFMVLNRSMQSPPQCMECEVAGGCAWCQGNNYDAAQTETIYQRAILYLQHAQGKSAGEPIFLGEIGQ